MIDNISSVHSGELRSGPSLPRSQ